MLCLGMLYYERSLENLRLSMFVWELSLGTSLGHMRLGILAWKRSLRHVLLGTFAQECFLGRLGSVAYTPGDFHVGWFASEHSFRNLRLDTFVWAFLWLELALKTFPLGYFIREPSVRIYRLCISLWELPPGDFREGAFAWELSLRNFRSGLFLQELSRLRTFP